MILGELETAAAMRVEARTADGSTMPGEANTLIPDGNGYTLNGKLIELKYPAQKTDIDFFLNRKTAHVCRIDSAFRGGEFIMTVEFFSGPVMHLGKINVLVDGENAKKTGDWKKLSESLGFTMGGDGYFVIQSSNEDRKDSQDGGAEETAESGNAIVEEFESEVQGIFSFAIIAPRNTILNVERLNAKTGEYFSLRKRFRPRNRKPQSNLHLVRGEVEFTSEKKALSDLCKPELESIKAQKGTYLDAWKTYTEERGNRLLKLAREFNGGEAKAYFDSTERTEGDVKLFLRSEVSIPSGFDEIEIFGTDAENPIFVQDRDCTFTDYLSKKREARNGKRLPFSVRGEVKKQSGNVLTLEVEPGADKIPKSGFITLCLTGEERQVERQQSAWKKIEEGKAGIPHLGLLLEDGAAIPQRQRQQKEPKMSARVYKKIFEKEPTEKQREAIRIALTTPDIALIQGPPGTGKTTVVSAILEIMNEMQDKHSVCSGKVLLSSYQHDAVINIIEDLSVNGLPTFKFGGRRGQGTYSEHIQEWCKGVQERLEEHTPDLKPRDSEIQFYSAKADYAGNPSGENRKKLLKAILENAAVSAETADKARDFLAQKPSEEQFESDFDEAARGRVLPLVRAIRINAPSFADDGRRRAEDLFDELDDIGYFKSNRDCEKVLEEAMEFKPENGERDTEFFKKLAIQKQALIEEFSENPFYIEETVSPQVLELCDAVSAELEQSRSKKDRKTLILSEWLKALQTNPQALQKAIQDCDFAYSATAQQSTTGEMARLKAANGSETYLFDAVIIDEAARAAPPDLLIPMCLAAKQIILVGDHRQLPQLVDEEICETIYSRKDSGLSEGEQRKLYELSLFEHLFYRLKELEKQDGIKRTVTLDTQHRTHPLLGDFATRHFYDEHGEHYGSSRPASDFSHNLPGIENKAAVWLNVPADKGAEEPMRPSFQRKAEAEAIAGKLAEFAASADGRKFSYGIITFYKAQLAAINDALKKRQIPDSARVRVGTVDSFQGLQFDVVFLSVVRSNRNADFGFLRSVNRQCVSMTRQKKALIIAGDADFCTAEEARKSGNIPALADFCDLCSENKEYGATL